jgi:uncharacterized protein
LQHPVLVAIKGIGGQDALDRGDGKGIGMNHLQFMVVPSLGCPAKCHYCFGPNRGPKMTAQRIGQTARFIQEIDREARLDKIKVTFHGGEPLAAGHDFFDLFLEQLTSGLPPDKRTELNLQSNLWLLDDAYCALFKKHHVSIGTSLDGPEAINDAQRGAGYFKKTMAGIDRARSWGLDVGCIATFTRSSAPLWRDIVDFFISERLSFSVHTSLPALQDPNFAYALCPEEKADLFLNLLDNYIQNRKKISISTFDQMAKSIPGGEGRICTFKDCLGMFLAVDPAGDIFPCQHFCGNPQYRLGNLDDEPSLETLLTSPAALRMKEREQRITEACRECTHYPYCKGGCTYNAWAGGNGSPKDPLCPAYAKIFGAIQDRLASEMGSEANIAAIADHPTGCGPDLLLKKGPLIDIIRSGPHPSQVARNAKRIVAAVEMAKGPDIPSVANRLVALGICRNENTALASLMSLQKSVMPEKTCLNNLYLHLTFACQLHCTHCYAQAEKTSKAEMSPGSLETLLGEARQTGFRQVVITGGEPLLHSERNKLLALLNRVKPTVRPMNLVLRTNLAMRLNDAELAKIAGAFHQVVVSIDGGREAHDARRGPGSYDAAVANMDAFQRLARSNSNAAEVSIAAVLRSQEIEGEPGWAVGKLAERLNIRRTRFRPLLPLGRAAEWDEPPQSEALGGYLDPMELIESGFRPVASCGLGQNLYVEPSGESFPCYSYHRPHAYLGNVIKNGLAAIIGADQFRDLSRHTVDTNHFCRQCEYRYLCGGACRAWGGESAQHDLDAPPADCTGLKQRAVKLFNAAYEYWRLDK